MICKTYSKYFNNTDESKNIATVPSDIITQLPVPYKWYDKGVCTRTVASANQCNQDNCCRMCLLGHSLNTPSLAPNILGKRNKGRPNELGQSPNLEKTLHKCPGRSQKLRLT